MEINGLQGVEVEVHDDSGISVPEAISNAGEDQAEQVRVRARSEVAWLRLVSEWFDQEAARVDRELAATR